MSVVCNLCPRKCGVNRDERAGFCGARTLTVARAGLHHFEEPPISGKNGSGTVFFSGCSLRCVFCQNFDVSRSRLGKKITVPELADLFRMLEDKGAHNVNLVTPAHFTEEIISALKLYRPKIPVLWNSHSYETVESIERIADYIDIFLPDLKYFAPERSLRYAGVSDYFETAIKSISKMTEKKSLLFGEDGLLKQGVLIRHLILPMNLDDTFRILDEVAERFPKVPVSLMSQYTPFGELEYPELRRRITPREYRRAAEHMQSLGLDGYVQELCSSEKFYIPDWDMRED